MLALRTLSRRRLPLRLRDALGLNALHRTKLKVGEQTIDSLLEILELVCKSSRFADVARLIKLQIVKIIIEMTEVVLTVAPVRNPRAKLPPMTFTQMEANLLREGLNRVTEYSVKRSCERNWRKEISLKP